MDKPFCDFCKYYRAYDENKAFIPCCRFYYTELPTFPFFLRSIAQQCPHFSKKIKSNNNEFNKTGEL